MVDEPTYLIVGGCFSASVLTPPMMRKEQTINVFIIFDPLFPGGQKIILSTSGQRCLPFNVVIVEIVI